MAYQALYRQWRPKLFSQVVGQDAIVKTLTRQVDSGRIAHAYLFSGTRGTGKTSTAQILSKAVNCENPQGGEPCGACSSCVALEEGASLDVEEIDAASNNGVDEIRALRDKIRYPPQSGRYRVYIIDEVHMLSTSAFNALLKTLEEPPPHAVMILATTEPQRLPATILSRCQRFDFKRISVGELAGRLREAADGAGVSYEEDALLAIARSAEGGMRDALSLLDVCMASGEAVTMDAVEVSLGAAGRGFLYAVTDALASGDAGAAFLRVDAAMRDGRDAAVLARDLSGHMRQLMILMAIGPDDGARLLEISPEEAARLLAQGQAMGAERATRALSILSRVEPEMRWAAHPRALLEVALSRICRPEEETDLASLMQRVEALEQKLARGIVAQPSAPVTVSAAEASPALVQTAPPSTRQSKPQSVQPPKPQAAQRQQTDAALWKDVLAIIRKKRISMFSQLRKARFIGLIGDTAKFSFAPEDKVFFDMMQLEPQMVTLREAFAEAAGREVSVAVLLGGGEPEPLPQAPPAQEDWVKDAISLFGRDKVDIIESGGDEL
jgi:DNA polymerase-3 subunit gamma/tau